MPLSRSLTAQNNQIIGAVPSSDWPTFDVYGYRFTIRSSSEWALDGISQDFAYFRDSSPNNALQIEMEVAEPDYDSLPCRDASVHTPRNIVYPAGTTKYIDYHGRGLGVHDTTTGSFKILSLDKNLLYESVYLFLLSQIGQFLDSRKMHRLHALGVSIEGRAILVLLPMGGGKSTLGSGLLNHPEVKLLSDDSPFIDSSGRAHAFPLHLGLLPGQEQEIPEQHRRHINRMEFGPKYLMNFNYFADRVCASAEPGLVFLGHRSLSRQCRIERAGFMAGMRAMLANCVVGLGLFHGLEFILDSGARELFSKAGLGISRLDNCLQLLRRSEVYSLYLGRDSEVNAKAIVECAHRCFR